MATAPTAMSTEKGQKDGQMQLKEFVVGVVRLACAAYPTTPAIAEALRRLLDEHIRCAPCGFRSSISARATSPRSLLACAGAGQLRFAPKIRLHALHGG